MGEPPTDHAEDIIFIDSNSYQVTTFDACTLCGEVFPETLTAENHSCDNLEDEYVCELCGNDFDTRVEMEQHNCSCKKENCLREDIGFKHVENSEQKQNNVCEDLGQKTFQSLNRKNSYRCSKSYERKDKFVCKNCSQIFTSQMLLAKHSCKIILKHSYVNQKKCKEALIPNSSLQNCISANKNDSNSSIIDCGELFTSVDKMINNRCYNKEGNESFYCRECSKTFLSKSALLKHKTLNANGDLTCPVCSRHFVLGCGLKIHMSTHEIKKLFSCTQCNKIFNNQNDLKHHYISHTKDKEKKRVITCKEKPYVCEICGMQFTIKDSLRIHMARHTGDLEFICGYCNFGFATKHRLRDHLRTHTGEKPYKCDTCGRKFSRQSHLKTHYFTHTGERPFMCVGCGKRFVQQSELKAHLRVHTGEKPFVCETCGKCFQFSGSLKRHQQTHKTVRQFPCDYCSKSFATSNSVKRHHYSHLGLKPFPCHLCNKRFTIKSVLISHQQKIHSFIPVSKNVQSIHEMLEVPPKPTLISYVCAVCGAYFNEASELRQHVKIHEGISPFMCNECGKCFSLKKCLTRHMLTHAEDASNVLRCEYCGKMFASKGNLSRHVQLHKGDKPYSCNLCDKSFVKNYMLQHHVRMKHLESDKMKEDFLCYICHKKFSQCFYLKEHIHTHLNSSHLPNAQHVT